VRYHFPPTASIPLSIENVPMHPVSPETVVSQLRWRFATKKFDPARKIPDNVWAALEEALILTPSSFGLQPWKFVVVSSQSIKDQLPPISWNQNQTRDASHEVVIAAKTGIDVEYIDRYVARTSEITGAPVAALGGFRGMMVGTLVPAKFDVGQWAAKQGYIALGQLMAAAAMLGIDTCPMEGFLAPKYDELLGLTAEGLTAVLVCPLGYRMADDPYAPRKKVRFAASEIVRHV